MKEIAFKSLFSQSVHFYGIAAVHRKWGGGNKNNYLARGRDENILSYTIRGGKNIYTAQYSQKQKTDSHPQTNGFSFFHTLLL